MSHKLSTSWTSKLRSIDWKKDFAKLKNR